MSASNFIFRYRVRMLTAIRLAEDAASEITVHEQLLKVSKQDGNWVVFTSSGFHREEEATKAGESFGRYLLLTGALHGWGVELGSNRKTLQFSDNIRQSIRKCCGDSVNTETHGLEVYKSNIPAFISLEARGTTRVRAATFAKELSNLPRDFHPYERKKRCAKLLNDAAFLGRYDSRFALCISAIEALCPNIPRKEAEIRAL